MQCNKITIEAKDLKNLYKNEEQEMNEMLWINEMS